MLEIFLATCLVTVILALSCAVWSLLERTAGERIDQVVDRLAAWMRRQ